MWDAHRLDPIVYTENLKQETTIWPPFTLSHLGILLFLVINVSGRHSCHVVFMKERALSLT